MLIAASRSLSIQSVPQAENFQNAVASVPPAALETLTPPAADPSKAVEPDVHALMVRDQLSRGETVVSLNSPSTFPGTALRPDIVNASESVASGIGNDSALGGRLGTTGLPRDSRFDDPNAAFDEPNAGLPQIGGFDPAHDLNIPGGEALTTVGSLIVSCAVGAAGGAKLGGGWGAAAGCAVGVATGLGQDQAADAIDAFVDWIAGGASPDEDITTVPMGTPHDMGVSGDPKSDPNPDGDVQGGYTPKFAAPSLNWLNHLNVKPDVGDPIGVDKDEPSNILRFFGQAVDPNPDADNANDGAAMKAILSTSGAVTDPTPGATLNILMMGTLRA